MTELLKKNTITRTRGSMIGLIISNFILGIILGIIGVYVPLGTYLIKMNVVDGSIFQEFVNGSRSILEWGQTLISIVLGIWTYLTLRLTKFRHGTHHSKNKDQAISPNTLFYSSVATRNGTVEIVLMTIVFVVSFLNTPVIRSLIINAFKQAEMELLLVILSGLDVLGVICYFLFWSFLRKIYTSYVEMKRATTWIRVGNTNSLLLAITLFFLNLDSLTSSHSTSFLPECMVSIHFIYPSVLIFSLGILVFKSIGNLYLMEQRKVKLLN
jgi:hypothetical protein